VRDKGEGKEQEPGGDHGEPHLYACSYQVDAAARHGLLHRSDVRAAERHSDVRAWAALLVDRVDRRQYHFCSLLYGRVEELCDRVRLEDDGAVRVGHLEVEERRKVDCRKARRGDGEDRRCDARGGYRRYAHAKDAQSNDDLSVIYHRTFGLVKPSLLK